MSQANFRTRLKFALMFAYPIGTAARQATEWPIRRQMRGELMLSASRVAWPFVGIPGRGSGVREAQAPFGHVEGLLSRAPFDVIPSW